HVRDYTVGGPEATNAEANNLVAADWYTPHVDRETMKALMARSNGIAARDTVLWLVLLVGSGILAYLSWGGWWAVPAFAVYGVMYGSASDARWHECGHRTAFPLETYERRHLPRRRIHGLSRAHQLALEPRTPPQRHDHRWP
ncbi:MAG: hypothetical protein ACKOIZ_04650, partial [Actinomycetota bacterium]